MTDERAKDLEHLRTVADEMSKQLATIEAQRDQYNKVIEEATARRAAVLRAISHLESGLMEGVTIQ